MSKFENKARLEILLELETKMKFKSICDSLNKTMSEQMISLINETIRVRTDLVKINQSNTKNKLDSLNGISIVDMYQRDSSIELPKDLVDYHSFENSVLLERVSSILSLNEENEAYRFFMGLINIIDNLKENQKIIFGETDNKGKISTKLVRNIYGNAIIFTLINAIDKGHEIYTYADTLKPVYVEDLYELLSDGITTSIHERTKVYDNLFFSKYNKAHFNQWLQWTFGLSRRNPIEEFNRLLRKNSEITKPSKNELELRLEKAIYNLRKRSTLFGLSEIGLKRAINKMIKFVELYSNYAGDYSPINLCRNETIHSILIKENKKCPLKCGL